MKIDKAIQYVKLESDYLAKKNEPESKKLRIKIVTALNMALEAMRKLEPVKPETEPFFDGRIYRCNSCGKHIRLTCVYPKPLYCAQCGQAIDWSEVEKDEQM